MRLRTHLQRLLLLVGFGLLACCAAAKLHELVLSRAAMRRFEDLRQATANNSAGAKSSSSNPLFPLQILFCGRSSESSTTKKV